MLQRKIFFVLIFFFTRAAALLSQSIDPHETFSGIYHGENIFIQNPFAPNGIGFCSTKIFINGIEDTLDETNSSAFEIDPSKLFFHDGDSISISIYHHEDCKPKILNPETFIVHSEIFKNIYIDSSYFLHFFSESGLGSGRSFYVQQFRWNKWVMIGDKIPVSDGIHEYTMDVKPFLINGENKFRVRLPIPCGYYESKPASCFANEPLIIFDSQTNCNSISFSRETLWELFDDSASIVKKGYGSSFDYSFLTKPKFFQLNYDNQSVQIKPNRCVPPTVADLNSVNTISPVIIIYPNPAQESFNISTGAEFSGYALTIEVSDLAGRTVNSTIVQGGTSSLVNVDNISDGIYFVRVMHNEEMISAQKLTVHH